MGDPNQTITIHTTDKVFAFKPQHCYKKNVVCQIKPNLSPQETKQVKKFFGIKP
jgi:hypothetical protein